MIDTLADDASCYDDDDMSNLVGPDEVAAMLNVKRNTVAQWRFRRLLPEPALVLSQIPIWKRSDIEEWAKLTGREIVSP